MSTNGSFTTTINRTDIVRIDVDKNRNSPIELEQTIVSRSESFCKCKHCNTPIKTNSIDHRRGKFFIASTSNPTYTANTSRYETYFFEGLLA